MNGRGSGHGMNIEPTGKVMPPCGQGIPARVEITDEMVERAAEVLFSFWWNEDEYGDRDECRTQARAALDAALNGEKP
jgi:hypothetical protein